MRVKKCLQVLLMVRRGMLLLVLLLNMKVGSVAHGSGSSKKLPKNALGNISDTG